MDKTSKPLEVTEIPAAYWQDSLDEAGKWSVGQNATKYLRFDRPERVVGFSIESGEIETKLVYLSHVRISISQEDGCWTVIFEDDHLPKEAVHDIHLSEGVEARFWKIEALTHHGSSNTHTELTTNPRCVLFGALKKVTCILGDGTTVGVMQRKNPVNADYCHHPWKAADVSLDEAVLPDGVHAELTSNEVILTNSFLKFGFSRLRPMMTFMGWDSEGTGRFTRNLLNNHRSVFGLPDNGPWLSQVEGNVPAGLCGGVMRMEGNTVYYDHVEPRSGLERSYAFCVEHDAMWLTIKQKVDRPMKAIECEAWRWGWNLREAVTATLAMPVRRGKNGRCSFPAIWHAPNFGSVAVELVEGDPLTTFLKVDSWRDKGLGSCGIECGVEVTQDGELLLLPGTHEIKVRFSRAALGLAASNHTSGNLHPAFRRAWGSAFGFRPEYFGMSNNAAALNCHLIQHGYADMAWHTASSPNAPTMMELCGYSLDLALSGGAAYGDNRKFFIDSDASLVIASGVYLERTRNRGWARKNWASLLECGQRLLERRSAEGLVASRELPGNSGLRHWSSNWWDVIAFGHLDAYVNALAYRAFRQVQSMAKWVGEEETSRCYAEAADRLHAAYFSCFFNPESGWLAGWRSQDGELHDHAFLFINGIAIVYGLVPESQARPIIEKLEALREETGFEHFHMGLPGNLLSIPRADSSSVPYLESNREDGWDSLGHYMNSGVTMSQAYYYVRALGLVGMPAADRIGQTILDAFEKGDVIGGLLSGIDWRYWDGRSSGYEGLLTDQLHVLLAVAQNLGRAGEIPLVWE